MEQFDQAFQDAAAVGVTVCVAAGDGGSSDGVNDGLAARRFPRLEPERPGLRRHHAECQRRQRSISSEVVWNDGSDGGATGGGISDQFAAAELPGRMPACRRRSTPAARSAAACPTSPATPTPTPATRSASTAPNTVFGGTSAVAPLWAGLVALLNQAIGKPVGFLNPNLYGSIAQAGVFRDITSGNNGAYSAGRGWDACTGWGRRRRRQAARGPQVREHLERIGPRHGQGPGTPRDGVPPRAGISIEARTEPRPHGSPRLREGSAFRITRRARSSIPPRAGHGSDPFATRRRRPHPLLGVPIHARQASRAGPDRAGGIDRRCAPTGC